MFKEVSMNVEDPVKPPLQISTSVPGSISGLKKSRLAVLAQVLGPVMHEISNPLTVLSGKAERIKALCQSSPPDPTAITDSADKMLKMTDRLTDIANHVKALTQKAPEVRSSLIGIGDLWKTLEGQLGPYLERNLTEFRLPLTRHDLAVYADPDVLQEVIVNLIDNSIEAISTQPNAQRWIRVSANLGLGHIRHHPAVEIRIVDSGIGISQEDEKHLFRAFFSNKAANNGLGLGLGLCFARHLLRTMAGELTYLPGEPHTTFLLRLPGRVSQE